MSKCKSFAPAINENSKILILGSMPGIKSLEEAHYYAHPQNRFWKVMSVLCNTDMVSMDYQTRIQTLLDNNFALWDVIKSCKREGSLDSAIENEKPNNIKALLKKYPNIETIYLNGNKAYSAFKKHFPDYLPLCRKMPSTSPANARFQLESLLKEWNIL